MAKNLPKPHRIVTYPIPGDDKGGRLFVFDSQHDRGGDGKNNAPYDDVILFCAGFPDDHGAFLPLANRMCEELYRKGGGGDDDDDDDDDHKKKVLCGVACLAGYDHSEEKPWTSWKPDGYTFDEWTVALRAAAKALRQEAAVSAVSGDGGSKTEDETTTTTFTTVFHDWGCLAGCFYTNRALDEGDALTAPNKIVYLDVLPGDAHPTAERKPQPAQTTLREKCAVVLYRIAFAFTFVLQRYLSKYAAQVAFGLSMLFLTITGFVPGGGLDNDYFEALHLDQYRLQYMMFPYWNVMKVMVKMLLFTKGGKDDKSAFPFHLPQLDKVPVLFLYGEGKNAMFHDVNVAAFLNEKHGADNDDSTGKTTTSTQQSKSMGVPNAAHWLYVQQQDVCLEEIRKFVLAK